MHYLVLKALVASPFMVYGVLFFGMFVEGDLFLLTAGFLLHRGVVHFLDSFVLLYLGMLLGDSLWHVAGTHLHRINSPYFKRVIVVAERFDGILRARLFHTMLVTKFMYGFHHPVLLRAGMIGVTRRAILRADALAGPIWILSVMGLGYLASASLFAVHRYLRIAEFGILATFIIFVVVERIITRRERKNPT
ncbi:MAG: DedA family protein [Minisyncoccota bacterium]